MNYNINKDFSKGGLIGALIGTLVSTQTHKPDDKVIHKVAKTGLIAGIGFALGSWIEKMTVKKK